MPLLDVKGLKTYFYTNRGVVKAVDGASFTVNENEIFCLVGETGCGKSVTALSIMRLIFPPGKILSGKALYKEEDLLKIPESEMQKIRGREISMVFQNPMNSLNPVFTIGYQISEAPTVHFNLSKKEAWKRTTDLIRDVKITDADTRAKCYPHVLSGGMRQRTMMAMMLSCNPNLLIADEPTTSLDVTIQAQILDLLIEIKKKRRMSVILITHNFGLVAEFGDRVAVMYCGKVVEIGDVTTIFRNPLHPYTRGLLRCLPIGYKRKSKLGFIPGTLPSPIDTPSGCSFHPRCEHSTKSCKLREPELVEYEKNHFVACHLYER